MNRVRSCVALATVAWLVAACTTESPSDPPEAPARPAESSDDPSADPDPDRAMDPTADWQLYRERFVTAEGRVVDSGNDGVSHSEGQGYALLFATAFDDRPTFELIWAWTNRHLQVRASDRLFSWQWTATEGVTDTNNATDGDLLIAWALLRAGERWQVPEWLHSAREIAVDVRMSMVLDSPHGLMLRPGAEGFERPSGPGTDGLGLVVNPAYWVFPAFPDLARLDPSPIWHQLTDSGLLLVDAARFGRWQLPPDWLAVPTFPVQASGEPTRSVLSPVTPADGFPPRFGYSAVRIPLYMHWAGLDDPTRVASFLDFWAFFDGARFVPAWTDLEDNSIASYDAPQGFHAVIDLTRAGRSDAPARVTQPTLRADQDYYSSTLFLLSHLARKETPS